MTTVWYFNVPVPTRLGGVPPDTADPVGYRKLFYNKS